MLESFSPTGEEPDIGSALGWEALHVSLLCLQVLETLNGRP